MSKCYKPYWVLIVINTTLSFTKLLGVNLLNLIIVKLSMVFNKNFVLCISSVIDASKQILTNSDLLQKLYVGIPYSPITTNTA